MLLLVFAYMRVRVDHDDERVDNITILKKIKYFDILLRRLHIFIKSHKLLGIIVFIYIYIYIQSHLNPTKIR